MQLKSIIVLNLVAVDVILQIFIAVKCGQMRQYSCNSGCAIIAVASKTLILQPIAVAERAM